MKIKAFASIATTAVLTAFLAVSVFADFGKLKVYAEGQFTDVPSTEWFASSVKDAYEFGLMNGNSATTFNPNGTLTVAEGVTIASRIYETISGEAIPEKSGANWYDKYVDYAIAKGIMEKGQFDGYDINIKRFEIAELLSAAAGELTAVNSITSVPDVAQGVDYADAVLGLYNAGILGGNDEYGNFAPNSYLLRSEISAMTVRIADSTKRVHKTLTPVEARAFTDSYYMIDNPWGGTMGGWTYDDRFDLFNFSGSGKNKISDASDEEYYAMTRDFAPEYEGIVRLKLGGDFRSNDNGVYIALENASEDRIVELTPVGGVWTLKGVNSISSNVSISEEVAEYYSVIIEVDLDKNTAGAIINNVDVGKVNISPDAVIQRLAIGTNKVGKGYATKSFAKMTKNYVLDESFVTNNKQRGKRPVNWTIDGDFVIEHGGGMLGDDVYSMYASSTAGTKSVATKDFEAISGKFVTEAYLLLPEKTDGAVVSFTNGGEDVFKFESKNNMLYIGDTQLHDYIPNVWQWLYVEADAVTGRATVKINGKVKAEIPFTAKAVDGVKVEFAPAKDAVMWVDDFEVYPLIDHADYPEYPKVAESTDYNIGINSCFLWRDQMAGEGWDAMSGFPEFDTYLGFYDEGTREVSDWEIKILAEHGVDFIHACWYTPSYTTFSQDTPIKESRFSHAAIHDGYMNAKYSNLVDFCIMWENSYGDVSSLEQFKEYIWNYWKEHYFSDERYARLDNKAILTVWSKEVLMKSLGGTIDDLEAAIKFMNDDIKTLGYDGIILLDQVQFVNGEGHYKNISNMGFDGAYAYHWGGGGYSAEYQISCNEGSTANALKYSHHIPTISNGFNAVGRHDSRSPVITGEDHLKVAENMKDILSRYSTGTWKDKTIMISTWNEYSEGTYAMPTAGTGFDYLENIRKVFTNSTEEHASTFDTPLTATQLARIGHLYPPSRSILRRQHFEKSEAESFVVTPDMLEPVRTYDMATGGQDAWDMEFGISYFSKENGVISGTGLSSDYGIRSIAPKFVPIKAENAPFLHIRLKSSKQHTFEIFFMTETAQSWSHSNRAQESHVSANEWHDYYLNMSKVGGWKGDVTGIRIDPLMDTGDFEISLVEFMNFKPTEDTTRRVVVNGTELTFAFEPQPTADGDIEVVAEARRGFFSSLRVLHTWNRFDGEGVLTIKTRDQHTFEFRVGSDKVIVDGVPRNLGYKLKLRDGLPVFHMKKLAELLGYRVSVDKYVTNVLSCSDEELEKINSRRENCWEFDFFDEIDGFHPQQCLFDIDGESNLHVRATGADVGVLKLVDFKADRYSHIILGVRYEEFLKGELPQFFFTTGLNPTWGWTADNCINGEYNFEGKKPGDTVEVVFDLSLNSNFKGTITGLRFDPVSRKENIKIDYIRCVFDEATLYAGMTLLEKPAWEFDAGDNVMGWKGQNCSVSAKGGFLYGECRAEDIAIINTDISLRPEDAQVVTVGVKYDEDICSDTPELFFSNDRSYSYSSDKSVRGSYRIPDGVKAGDTVELTFDLSGCSKYRGVINSLRIDIHGGKYPFAVDYVRLYKKDGFVIEEESKEIKMNQATRPTVAIIGDVTNIPEGISVTGGGAGALSIVADPENPDNKVFKISCTLGGDFFTYFHIYMNFEYGKTYSVSYNLYPLKNFNGEDYTSVIGGNIMYGRDGKSVENHIYDPYPNKSSGSGWTPVETSFAVEEGYNPTESDCIQLWGKSYNNAGIEFLIKDIVIMPM